ncbi:hypothetical protein DFP73DRAFT_593270 [Morchella snyderi]|nr:hypothetical protein DFP73DRAFT_593270 [Morchella snyderi]
MVGPCDEGGQRGTGKAEAGRKTRTKTRTGPGGLSRRAEPERKRERRFRSPPPGREAQGRNGVYEENAFWNQDLNKAYLNYKKKRLRKKGKLFEEKEEASLYTGILTLLINPDNATGKTGDAERERDEERTGEERRQERIGKQRRRTEARKDKDSGAYSDARQNRSRRERNRRQS